MERTKKRIATCAAAALLLQILFTGCGRVKTASSGAQTDASAVQEDEAVPGVHTYSGFDTQEGERMNEITEDYGAKAVQLALLDGNDIKTFCYGYADVKIRLPLTEDTKYRVASLSKLVVASIFMAAAERGYVDENADISEYFGETCRNPRYEDIAITPSMLLTHTASLISDGDYTYYSGMLSERSNYLRAKPGTEYVYSNFGYDLIECLLERATGQSFNSLAKEYLFEPLGIDASYIYNELEDPYDVGMLYGEGGLSVRELASFEGEEELGRDLSLAAGNLIISAKDYVKILGMLIHEGCDVDSVQVLSAETVEKMLASRMSLSGFDVAYGSQIQTDVIDGETVYVHTGSAYGMYSAYVFNPETKKAMAVLTTGEERSTESNGIYSLCMDLIREVW